MYDELVKRLRKEAEVPDNYPEDSILMQEAADAIEELRKRVPKRPHGDLIDRDSLISNHAIDKYDCSEVISVENIRNAPTIIPAEED